MKKIVLITGATSGIGKATARLLAQSGYRLILTGRREDRLQQMKEEMESLGELLTGSLEILKPGGILVVLTYHSLEDRLLKRFMRSGNLHGDVKKDFYGHIERPFELLTKSPLIPGKEEWLRNTRSHSAKMRVARKTETL